MFGDGEERRGKIKQIGNLSNQSDSSTGIENMPRFPNILCIP